MEHRPMTIANSVAVLGMARMEYSRVAALRMEIGATKQLQDAKAPVVAPSSNMVCRVEQQTQLVAHLWGKIMCCPVEELAMMAHFGAMRARRIAQLVQEPF